MDLFDLEGAVLPRGGLGEARMIAAGVAQMPGDGPPWPVLVVARRGRRRIRTRRSRLRGETRALGLRRGR
jgi:hypothetical protein